jgi:type VI secretion system protein ImpG
MEDLLPHYERELAMLRRSLHDFAARYPKIAARLAVSGEHSEDPHVERMLQSFALLAARIDTRLDDDYPEFTEGMLQALYPHYLRPYPSCSIVEFDIEGLFEGLSGPVSLPRGTDLVSKERQCRFRTAYDVTLSPMRVQAARYLRSAQAPANASLPPDTSGLVAITFASAASAAGLHAMAPSTIRLHVHGQREIVTALTDTLLLRATTAFVEADGSGRWIALDRYPIQAAGFDAGDALVQDGTRASAPFRLLAEYFAFPDKFDFLDIDAASMLSVAGPCRTLTLYVAIEGVHDDSWAAQRMAQLSDKHLKLFCTPVVNLFPTKAEPIKIDALAHSYAVTPKVQKSASTSDFEVYSVDAVYPEKQSASSPSSFQPFAGLMHGSAATLSGPYWVARTDDDPARRDARRTLLAFVGLDGEPAAVPVTQVAVDVTCTNRNVPATLPYGSAAGDLMIEGGSMACLLVLLRRPTESVDAQRSHGALWRLISQFTPHAITLSVEGLDQIKRLLRQYAALSPTPARQIEGIAFAGCRSTMQWMVMDPCPSLVRGIEVTLAVDEQVFSGSSVSAFIDVMDRFFAPFAPDNSFVQLVAISKTTGALLRRCEPRQGAVALL